MNELLENSQNGDVSVGEGQEENQPPSREFPPAYTPFLPVLDRLSTPLKTALKGHLASLESLFTAVQSRDQHLLGDFEGVGGLTHRGDLSRILQSELLLRTEAPMEFLRRLSEHETLYMETERSDPSEKMIFRLIISAGPELMGHGRIMALACLIFLARVAHVKNTALHWCFLPSDNPEWFSDVTVNSIKRFMRFAAFANASAEDIETANTLWATQYESINSADNIFQDWIIGAETLGGRQEHKDVLAQTPNALSLTMDPPGESALRTGLVDLKRRQSRVKRVRLEFPADRVCVSALNQPFAPVRPSQVQGKDSYGEAAIPTLNGWEPLYFCSPGQGRFIVRFEHFRRGLLLFEDDVNPNVKLGRPIFIPLPEDIQLAGVHFSNSGNTISVLAQRGAGSDERLIFNRCFDGDVVDAPFEKIVTSHHLFAKQRAHAIPPLQTASATFGYTTSGQPFKCKWKRHKGSSIQILYKENKILTSDGHFQATLFDLGSKKDEDREIGVRVKFGLKSALWNFHVDSKLGFNVLRGAAFDVAQKGTIALSVAKGRWTIIECGQNPEEFSEANIHLAPYERILSAGGLDNVMELTVFSDPVYGGDGRLQIRRYSDWLGSPSKTRTLYKFGTTKQPLHGLRYLPDNRFGGVLLDSNGDPETFVFLQRKDGQYKKHSIPFDQMFAHAIEVSPEKMFG